MYSLHRGGDAARVVQQILLLERRMNVVGHLCLWYLRLWRAYLL